MSQSSDRCPIFQALFSNHRALASTLSMLFKGPQVLRMVNEHELIKTSIFFFDVLKLSIETINVCFLVMKAPDWVTNLPNAEIL